LARGVGALAPTLKSLKTWAFAPEVPAFDVSGPVCETTSRLLGGRRLILGFNVGKLEVTARELLVGSRFFSPLRYGYQFFFDRERYAHRLRMRNFYSSLIRKGDLVFDVGAHVGRYSEIFTDLGATVVSIEPNPRCCEQLRRLAKVRDVHVEQCAAGDTPGKLKLRICDNSVLSTVSEDYYQEASKSPIHKGEHWTESVDVQIVRLDQLAKRYGIPAFVKIDAEGYDDRVLLGMSFRPRVLTFEYHSHVVRDVPVRCFQAPVLSSGYEFNFSRGLSLTYASEKWLGAKELQERLVEFAGDEVYGDVVARSTSVDTAREG